MGSFNRESYFHAALKELKIWCKENGHTFKKDVHVSVGHTQIRDSIGITHSSNSSSDGKNHIFISPTINDTLQVLEVLLHELVHCMDDCQSDHGKTFIAIAKDVGLVGPWSKTSASDRLTERLKTIVDKIGEYKSPVLIAAAKPKTQSTRMLKVVCPHCGYNLRTTRKWIDTGLPTCHCGYEMEEA